MRPRDSVLRLCGIAVLLLCAFIARQARTAPGDGARVSELLWMGSDLSSSDEWVEVGCPPSQNDVCDVAGWTLSVMNSAGNDVLLIRFATGTVITPGTGIIIARNVADASRLRDEPFAVVSSLLLPNSKLRVTLRDASGEVADIADDGSGFPLEGANPSGGMHRASMERVRFDLPGSDAAAWRTAQEQAGFDDGAMTFGNPGITREADPSDFSCDGGNPQIDVQSGDASGIGKVTINVQALSVPNDAECLWDFGDGFASTSCNPPSHTFRDIGSFVIRLGVTTACGSLTERSLRVTVREHGDDPESLCIPSLFTGLMLSEALPRPADDEEEWIELFNGSGMERRLCGWSIDDNEGGSSPFALDALRIDEDEHLVLPRSLTHIALNDDADAIRLIDPNGTVIAVPYRKAVTGQSLAMREDGTWLRTPYPTPGEANRFRPVRDVPRTVRIASAMPNPAGDDAGAEWFSMKNISGRPVMLFGMFITSGSRTFAFPSSAALHSGEEKVFAAGDLGIALTNTRGSIALRDSADLLLDALSWNSAGDDEVIHMPLESQIIQGEVIAIHADGSLDIGVPGVRKRDRFSRIEHRAIGGISITDVDAAVAVMETLLIDPHVRVLDSGDIITSAHISLADALVRRGLAGPANDDAWLIALADDARTDRLGMWNDFTDAPQSSVIADTGEPLLVATAGISDSPLQIPGDATARFALSEAVAVPQTGSEEWIEIVCEETEETDGTEEAKGGAVTDEEGCDAGMWMVDDIADGGSKPYRIPAGTIVQAGETLVLKKSQTKLSLNDTGDAVRLLRPDGDEVDVMTFGKLPRGSAIARMGNTTCITTVPTPGILPNHCKAIPQPSKPSKPTKPSSPKPDTPGQAAVRALIAKTASGSSVETLGPGPESRTPIFRYWEAIFFLLATLAQVVLWRWLKR